MKDQENPLQEVISGLHTGLLEDREIDEALSHEYHMDPFPAWNLHLDDGVGEKCLHQLHVPVLEMDQEDLSYQKHPQDESHQASFLRCGQITLSKEGPLKLINLAVAEREPVSEAERETLSCTCEGRAGPGYRWPGGHSIILGPLSPWT